MAENQKKGRDPTWDIARGFGMALVIYGHLIEPMWPARPGGTYLQSAFIQWQILYAFHMLLFFLISGAVNQSLPRKAWPDVLNGSLRLLALVWIVHLIGGVALIATGYAPDVKTFGDAIAAIGWPYIEGQSWSVGVLWFLTSLCFVQLISYAALRIAPPLAIVAVAVILTAGSQYVPNYFLLKTWAPGVAFFVLGYWLVQRGIVMPSWAWLPLVIALVFVAPLNKGCTFSYSETCYNVPPGFGVWMFAGRYGYLPLFFLSALVGSLAVVSLGRALSSFSASSILTYAGRNSLNLFIVNGFWTIFVTPNLGSWNVPRFDSMIVTILFYLALFIGVVGVHLAAVAILKPALDALDKAAQVIASAITNLVSGGVLSRQQPAVR